MLIVLLTSYLFSSLSDRKPVDNEDEVVVMILPDYQMVEYVERIASQLSGDTVCDSNLYINSREILVSLIWPRFR